MNSFLYLVRPLHPFLWFLQHCSQYLRCPPLPSSTTTSQYTTTFSPQPLPTPCSTKKKCPTFLALILHLWPQANRTLQPLLRKLPFAKPLYCRAGLCYSVSKFYSFSNCGSSNYPTWISLHSYPHHPYSRTMWTVRPLIPLTHDHPQSSIERVLAMIGIYFRLSSPFWATCAQLHNSHFMLLWHYLTTFRSYIHQLDTQQPPPPTHRWHHLKPYLLTSTPHHPPTAQPIIQIPYTYITAHLTISHYPSHTNTHTHTY